MTSRRTKISPKTGRGLGQVTHTIFGSTVGYPSDSLASCYLTLPSNSSMDYYPENRVARYTTKLANTIELEGDWEVGLLEMSTPSELVNIVEERCYYIIYVNRRYHNRISIGILPKHSPLLNEMHRQQRTQAPIPDGQPLMVQFCLLYTSPSPRDRQKSRMPSSA